MRRKAIIISSAFVIFILAFAVYALTRPNSAVESVPVQGETLCPEQEYTAQASYEIYLDNVEENEPFTPCCPYFVAVDLREIPLSAHENYEWVIPPVFAEVSSFHNGLAVAQKCCRFGIINEQGEIILPFIYGGFFREGARINDWGIGNALERGFIAAQYGGRWGAIDLAGEIIIPFKYDDVNIYHESGLAAARIGGVRESGRTSALIEVATGKEIVPSGRYQSIWPFGFTSFGGGIAHVTANNLHGAVCVATGETIIPARYEEIRSPLRNIGFLFARGNLQWVLYDSQGTVIRRFSGEEIPAQAFAFHTSSDFDVRGDRILINPQERNAFILDIDGNDIIPPNYSSIRLTTLHVHEGSVSENWAIVSTGEEHGIICIITGDVILPLRPKGYKNMGLNVYDENTAIVIEATGFEWRDRVFTFIDIATNREIEPPESFHYWAGPQPRDELPYKITSREYGEHSEYVFFGISDLQGNEIFPQTLSSVRRFGENLLRICDTDEGILQSRLYDFTTWEEILPRHDFIDLPGGGVNSARLALINQGGVRLHASIMGGEWGIITDTGEIVVPAIMNFERVRYESDGVFAVQRDGNWGFIRVEIPVCN